MKTIKEITPLKSENPFIILKHKNARFDYPSHFHEEFELNLILNFEGSRVVGNSFEDCELNDLTLIGPNLNHYWRSKEVITQSEVITIQFSRSFFTSKLLNYGVFSDIKLLLDNSKYGVTFGEQTKKIMIKKIKSLKDANDFSTFISFFEILQALSISKDMRILNSRMHITENQLRENEVTTKVINYIERNYDQNIKISDVCKLVHMSASSFSHFFKKRTGQNFTQYLRDYRLNVITKLLIQSDKTVKEISYQTGFNTLSNLNKSFKMKYGISPRVYRANYNDRMKNLK